RWRSSACRCRISAPRIRTTSRRRTSSWRRTSFPRTTAGKCSPRSAVRRRPAEPARRPRRTPRADRSGRGRDGRAPGRSGPGCPGTGRARRRRVRPGRRDLLGALDLLTEVGQFLGRARGTQLRQQVAFLLLDVVPYVLHQLVQQLFELRVLRLEPFEVLHDLLGFRVLLDLVVGELVAV